MTAEFLPPFEQAKAEAGKCLGDLRKLAKTLSRAAEKARANYESLLPEWESLQSLLRLVRRTLAGQYRPADSTVLLALAAILYFLNPLDLIPDAVPVLGLIDDGAVITWVVKTNLRELSRFRNWEYKQAVKSARTDPAP